MREQMQFDVIIVGAGPAGLSAAIRLMQLKPALSVCILEKGSSVGAHSLGGAILEPRALSELLPDWQNRNAPIQTAVCEDQFLFLTKNKSFKMPTPPQMQNDGNYIISVGQLCTWLAKEAEQLGVNIFPEFAATDIIYEANKVLGVITGEKGIGKNGERTSTYQAGYELRATTTFFAEGCRGSLTDQIIEKFSLRKKPQTYGLGFKEIWEIPEKLHQTGLAIHTVGWPLDHKTYGGGFVYHADQLKIFLGYVVGLDYQNPYLNPYEEFQQFKTHSFLYPLLKNAKRIMYGAKTLSEGGLQALPQLTFPGGMFIGDCAGFLNVPKIKGIHTAMKSGMIAAESFIEKSDYAANFKKSWVYEELHSVRNIRPAMNWGLLPGMAYAALDTYVLRGKAPWTLQNHRDHLQLKNAADSPKKEYPPHDNVVTFDLMASVFLTNSKIDENQPCHLKLKNPEKAIAINYVEYASPETRYCPAGVYEILYDENNAPRFHMNYANCIQCKACDIKDPTQNIVWTPPEGGCGPQYGIM